MLRWENFRGAGRQTGLATAKAVGKQLKKRVLDDNSSHRKLVSRFVLPGSFAPAKNRMYGLIDSFYNEYISTGALLQSSFFLKDDIKSFSYTHP